MTTIEYWREGISNAAEECGVVLTSEQLDYIAEAVDGGHENFGQAFYSPPASDRPAAIEREWAEKVRKLEAALERYRANAETAVRAALRMRDDVPIIIEEHGEVFRHDGRTERVL